MQSTTQNSMYLIIMALTKFILNSYAVMIYEIISIFNYYFRFPLEFQFILNDYIWHFLHSFFFILQAILCQILTEWLMNKHYTLYNILAMCNVFTARCQHKTKLKSLFRGNKCCLCLFLVAQHFTVFQFNFFSSFSFWWISWLWPRFGEKKNLILQISKNLEEIVYYNIMKLYKHYG